MEKSLIIQREEGVATIFLNKAGAGNTFDEQMVKDLTEALLELEESTDIKVIVLKGNGVDFSQGADHQWDERRSQLSYEECHQDCMEVAKMLYVFFSLTKPTVVVAHGHVQGLAVGLVAAADVAMCTENTTFAMTDVRYGLIPSLIAPYVVRAIGQRFMKRYSLTAEPFSGKKACEMGLVHNCYATAEILTSQLTNAIDHLCNNQPEAMRLTKQLAEIVSEHSIDDQVLESTSEWLSNRIQSDEAKAQLSTLIKDKM